MQNNVFSCEFFVSFVSLNEWIVPYEQCRWVPKHCTNMYFNSHLHSDNRREEKLSWTTLNGHFFSDLHNSQPSNGANWKWIAYNTTSKRNRFLVFSGSLAREAHTKHFAIFVCCTISMPMDFFFLIGFSIWGSQCDSFNRA